VTLRLAPPSKVVAASCLLSRIPASPLYVLSLYALATSEYATKYIYSMEGHLPGGRVCFLPGSSYETWHAATAATVRKVGPIRRWRPPPEEASYRVLNACLSRAPGSAICLACLQGEALVSS